MAELERQSDGSYVRKAEKEERKSDDRRWASAKDPSASLWATVKSLRNRQSWRRQSDELSLRLYSDMQYVGYRSQSGAYQLADVLDSRMGDNVIRSIVRTLNSKIARRRSRPYVVTNAGSWRARQAAENLEKWLLGKLRDVKADSELFPLFRLHSLVIGTGFIRSYGDPDRGAMLEVIPPHEVLVDDSEARYGSPRNIYFIRTVDAGVLKTRYPEAEDIINETASGRNANDEWAQGVGAWDQEPTSDVIVTVEAIHLPSGPDAGDGRHVIVTSAGTIYDAPWKRDHFPLAVMRRERRPMGYWGIGVPENLAGAQIEINRTSLARQEIVELLAAPYWLVERGMKVVKSHISNLIGRVMEWTSTGSGHKPELVSLPAVPPDIWQHQDSLKKGAFENEGVSQLSAQMLKPMGLNSGKALRAYTELESELLADLMADYESGLLSACELLIEEQTELAELAESTTDEKLKERLSEQAVTFVGDGKIEQIKWTDLDLQNDLKHYVIEILPASALASTLSARIEDVYDLRDLGAVSEPEEIQDYLELPDRKRMRRKALSHRHLLEKVIELKIIEKGQEITPEPTWDLNLAIKLGLEAINELQLYEDAPVDRLELLRIFVATCGKMLEAATLPDPTAPVPGPDMMGMDPGLMDPSMMPPEGMMPDVGTGIPGPGPIPPDLGAGPAGPLPAGPIV